MDVHVVAQMDEVSRTGKILGLKWNNAALFLNLPVRIKSFLRVRDSTFQGCLHCTRVVTHLGCSDSTVLQRTRAYFQSVPPLLDSQSWDRLHTVKLKVDKSALDTL